MSVRKELLTFCALEITLRKMDDHIAEAEKAVPQMAIAVLDEVQRVICNKQTNDFEKVDDIVRIFMKNGIATGECHDF